MNCLVIEDETPAQELISSYIQSCPLLNCIGVYSNALEAQKTLNSNSVDLLFLDIDLPLINGIDLLKSLSKAPQVIITTAYPEYALEGFELDVTDYLLKPFSFSRFLKATNKAISKHKAVLEDKAADEIQNRETVVFHLDKTLYQIHQNSISHISSDKDYIIFHTRERKFMIIGSLKHWLNKLNKTHFVRIHKSYIVNLSYIKKVSGNEIYLDELTLPVGRMYRQNFMSAFVSE